VKTHWKKEKKIFCSECRRCIRHRHQWFGSGFEAAVHTGNEMKWWIAQETMHTSELSLRQSV